MSFESVICRTRYMLFKDKRPAAQAGGTGAVCHGRGTVAGNTAARMYAGGCEGEGAFTMCVGGMNAPARRTLTGTADKNSWA